MNKRKVRSVLETHSEAQHLIVLGVHGLSLLCTSGVILSIEGNPTQLKNDVSLSLNHRKPTCYQQISINCEIIVAKQ